MGSAALFKQDGSHIPLLEAFIRDFVMLHLASLRDRHDPASLPVPDDISLETIPCRYQFKCATSGVANDSFHISLNDFAPISHVCLPCPIPIDRLTVSGQDNIDHPTTQLQSVDQQICGDPHASPSPATCPLPATSASSHIHGCRPGVSKLASIIASCIIQWGLDDNDTKYIAEKLLRLGGVTPEQTNGEHENRSGFRRVILLGKRIFSRRG
jgi:hypothetical protein